MLSISHSSCCSFRPRESSGKAFSPWTTTPTSNLINTARACDDRFESIGGVCHAAELPSLQLAIIDVTMPHPCCLPSATDPTPTGDARERQLPARFRAFSGNLVGPESAEAVSKRSARFCDAAQTSEFRVFSRSARRYGSIFGWLGSGLGVFTQPAPEAGIDQGCRQNIAKGRLRSFEAATQNGRSDEIAVVPDGVATVEPTGPLKGLRRVSHRCEFL